MLQELHGKNKMQRPKGNNEIKTVKYLTPNHYPRNGQMGDTNPFSDIS